MLIPKELAGAGRLYLEDLKVGQRFVSPSSTLTEAEIKAFAGSYDPQPFHLDGEAAKSSLFEGLAASGWHTATIAMRLMVESTPIAGGLVGASGELSWPRPTRPGDTLHVESEIVDVMFSRSRPDRGWAKVRNRTLNQKGEVVQEFVVNCVVPRRVAGAVAKAE